jgi:hypothetical protein
MVVWMSNVPLRSFWVGFVSEISINIKSITFSTYEPKFSTVPSKKPMDLLLIHAIMCYHRTVKFIFAIMIDMLGYISSSIFFNLDSFFTYFISPNNLDATTFLLGLFV